MKKPAYIILVVIIILAIVVVIRNHKVSSPAPTVLDDLIRVDSPSQNAKITSPLVVKGQARGNWFFEASFPILIEDSNGKVIGQGHAEAQKDWMTTDFVPFVATIDFNMPADANAGGQQGSQSSRGSIILKNDNPSGQASTSRSIEIPVIF